MNPEIELSILRDYLSNKKVLDITKEYKISTATVSKILKKNDIQMRNKKDSIGSIYAESTILNYSFEEIAKKHNISIKEVKRRFKKERNRKVVTSYQKGMSIRDLCITYNLSNMAIYHILDKAEVPRKTDTRAPKREFLPINDWQKVKILEAYQTKQMSVNDILNMYNVSKHQLYQLLYANNVELRGSHSINEESRKKIKEEYEAGATKTELSNKYKISRALISMIVE